MTDQEIMNIGIPILIAAAALAMLGPWLQARNSAAGRFKRLAGLTGRKFMNLRETARFLEQVGYPEAASLKDRLATAKTLMYDLKGGPQSRGATFPGSYSNAVYKLLMQGGMEESAGGGRRVFVLESEELYSRRRSSDVQKEQRRLVLHGWRLAGGGEASLQLDNARLEQLRPAFRFLESGPAMIHAAVHLPAGSAARAVSDQASWERLRDVLS